jgi:hypothetical protein
VRAAAESFQRIGYPMFAAQALENAAVLHAEKGDLAAARAAYLEGVDGYRDLDAQPAPNDLGDRPSQQPEAIRPAAAGLSSPVVTRTTSSPLLERAQRLDRTQGDVPRYHPEDGPVPPV